MEALCLKIKSILTLIYVFEIPDGYFTLELDKSYDYHTELYDLP